MKKEYNHEKLEQLLLSQKRILTVEELVAYTGLSKSDIYHKVQQRKIPHSRPSGKILRFDLDLINSWLLSNPVMPDDSEQLATAYVANNPLKGGMI